jgi:hypothetical protein
VLGLLASNERRASEAYLKKRAWIGVKLGELDLHLEYFIFGQLVWVLVQWSIRFESILSVRLLQFRTEQLWQMMDLGSETVSD